MANKKKVMLITGSSGRIGKALCKRFGEKYQIVGFDRHKGVGENIDHVEMDVSSDESVKKGMDYVRNKYGSRIGPVIHLAAYYSFSQGELSLYEEITVQGTRRILDALQDFDEVEQFHFASTLLVYKPCALGVKINEGSPVDAKWDYPKSKVETEKVIKEHGGKIPTVVMRIAGCYDNECHSIPIGHNIQRIYEHELDSHLFPGDVRHGNPFLHLEDLVDAYELAIEKRKSLPQNLIVNIGEDLTIPYGKLQNMISEVLEHKDFEVFRVPKWVAKTGAFVEDEIPGFDTFIQPWMIDVADDNYELDISFAKEMLGWSPKRYLDRYLPVMMELLKTDPIKWYEINQFDMSERMKKHIQDQKTHA
ncbi:NAD(P)-dependent oxidoreductase [Chlamydiales bacterium]|nr:NAD(P)-dependent oxidoreductase [Chlamydiales bacterium]